MNILLLSRFFSPSVGGSELLFCIIAEFLAQNGHNVWVIANKLEAMDSPIHKNIKTIFVSSQTSQRIKSWKQKDKLRYHISAIIAGLRRRRPKPSLKV